MWEYYSRNLFGWLFSDGLGGGVAWFEFVSFRLRLCFSYFQKENKLHPQTVWMVYVVALLSKITESLVARYVSFGFIFQECIPISSVLRFLLGNLGIWYVVFGSNYWSLIEPECSLCLWIIWRTKSSKLQFFTPKVSNEPTWGPWVSGSWLW